MTFEFLLPEVRRHPYPLLFATVSGAHLYGFPSPDSDFDLRGAHLLPLREVIGMAPQQETVEVSRKDEALELDMVTHDVKKFMAMMLKRNGYVLEQLLSPLVVHSTPEHEELRALGRKCVTRHHIHHYKGFAHTQWELFDKERPRRVKPLLYVYRVLLTGIWLMRTGEIEANLVTLNQEFRLPQVPGLVACKTGGVEHQPIEGEDRDFHRREFERLLAQLESAAAASALPEETPVRGALNDLLVRLRMGSAGPEPKSS